MKSHHMTSSAGHKFIGDARLSTMLKQLMSNLDQLETSDLLLKHYITLSWIFSKDGRQEIFFEKTIWLDYYE